MAEESYVPTPIEEAKKYLESIDDPQVAAVYDHPDLSNKLTQEDRRVITNFVYHLKSKRKSQQNSEAQRTEQEKLYQIRHKSYCCRRLMTLDNHF
jgi:hypothetical protein